MRRKLQIIWIVLLANFNIYGQWTQLERMVPLPKLEYLTETRGAPDAMASKIFQDSYGYVWLVSFQGVFKYNGYEFKKYQNKLLDSTSISSTRVWDIFEDDRKNLWIASDGGLDLFDRATETFINFKPHPQIDPLERKFLGATLNVHQDRKKRLWVATSYGLTLFDLDRMEFTKDIYLVDDTEVNEKSFGRNRLIETPDGSIWCLTGDHLLQTMCTDNEADTIRLGKVIDFGFRTSVTDFADMGEGKYYMSSYKGLKSWHYLDTFLRDVFISDQINQRQHSIEKINDHVLWLMLSELGAVKIDLADSTYWIFGNGNVNEEKKFHPGGNHIWKANNGNLWVSSVHGLWRIKMNEDGFWFEKYSSLWKSQANTITDAIRDNSGTIFISTYEGIVRHKHNGERSKLPFIINGDQHFINARELWADDQNEVWASLVSRTGIGVYKCETDGEFFEEVFIDKTLQRAMTEHFEKDLSSSDSMWLGTNNGLYHIDENSLQYINYKPKDIFPQLPRNRVKKILDDGDEALWFYYMGGGAVGKFDVRDKTWHRYPPDKDEAFMLSGNVLDYDLQGDSILWIATMKGLVSFDLSSKRYTFHDQKVNFSESYFLKVRVAKNGTIWLLTNQYLVQYRPNSKQLIEYYLFAELGRNRVLEIFSRDQIFVGGSTGYCLLNPNNIRKDSSQASVLMTGFNIGDRTMLFDSATEDVRTIEISSRDNVISFDFVGLHFEEPSNNEYKAKLEGFDPNWRNIGTRRNIGYTNLAPGDYQFKVKASNADGVWSGPMEIGLIVHPTFVETFGFKVLMGFLLASIIYMVYRNRRHQMELRQKKEIAEESDAYKTKFLANISHEIRTPMNAIVGMSRLLEDTNQDKKQKQFTNAIRHSSENLLQVVNDLLDHSKIESGQFQFLNRPFDLELAIKQAAQTLVFKAEEKGIAFMSKIEDDVPLYLSGDPVRLNQVLLNLVGNAIKFTDNGNVTIAVSKASEQDLLVWIEFMISDTGIGIPKNKLMTIFDSFNQADEDTFVEYGGTGLGLSIVKQLIEQQNGALDVSSKIGEGSVFTFVLPFERALRPTKTNQSKIEMSGLSHMKVLVVDDTYFNQVLATELLKKYMNDVSVEIADNGEVALEKMKQENFDLILMDVRMPVMNGYEATQAIRRMADPTKRNVPIIALTASAIRTQLDQCIAVGMNSYVTKPIDSHELLKIIHKVMAPKT